MDTEQTLLIFSAVVCCAVLVRAVRERPAALGWFAVVALIALGSGIAFLAFRPAAAYVAFGLTLVFAIVPVRLVRRAALLSMREDYARAARFMRWAAALHPLDGFRHRASYLDALELAIDDADGTELAWFAMVSVGRDVDGSYPGSSYGKNHLPVTCADWPVSTWSEMIPSAEVLEAYPLFGRIQPPRPSECTGWTGELRNDLLVVAAPATPVLVIGNVDDPVTPIEDTEYLASAISRSRLVTVDAGVHGSYATGNTCADRAVEDYLVRAVAPRNGLKCPAG